MAERYEEASTRCFRLLQEECDATRAERDALRAALRGLRGELAAMLSKENECELTHTPRMMWLKRLHDDADDALLREG